MTTFNTALSSGQKTLLRSRHYEGDYLLYAFSNRVVFAGQFNSETTTLQTWAQFDYNNVTVGAYTDVLVNMVILAGNSNAIADATFRGRVRLTPSSTIIYCNESSQDFIVGTYFWIIDTREPQYRLSRPDASGVQLVDYDLAFALPQPEIVLSPTPTAGPCAIGTGKLRIAFNASNSYAVASGATVVSYLYSFPSATVISGALNTSTVTVDVPGGEQWGRLTVTDSNGITQFRDIPIFARDDTHPASVGFDALVISGDFQRGWTLSAPAFAGVDSLLPNTFCMVWRENETYGSTNGALETSSTLAFIGWFNKETDSVTADPVSSIVSDAKFEVTGIGARMARLAKELVPFEISAIPSVWGDITNLTPWRAIAHFMQRYTTISTLCDLTFDSTDNTFVFPEISDQGQNVYESIQGIAQQINANLEFAPDGRLEIVRDATYLTVAERALLTTVIDYTSSDIVDTLGRDLSPNPSVGIVDADGACYSALNGNVQVFTVRSPGHAQGEAQGTDTLPSQILAAHDNTGFGIYELENRAGNRFNFVNLSETLTVRHNDGYTFLIPSRAQLFTFTLDTTIYGANNVQRIIYTSSVKWMLDSVTYTRVVGDTGFTTEVEAVYRRLCDPGDPGDDTTSLAPGQTDPTLTDIGLPAFGFELPNITFPDSGLDIGDISPSSLLPPPGRISAFKGDELLACNNTNVWWLSKFISLKHPIANVITPADIGSYLCKSVAVSPFYNNTTIPSYLLASDGTNSAVWRTDNAASPSPISTKGADVTGIFSLVRATSVFHSIMALNPDNASTIVPFDFTTTNGGFINTVDGTATPTTDGVWTNGTGWVATAYVIASGHTVVAVDIDLAFMSPVIIEGGKMTYNITKGTFSGTGINNAIILTLSGGGSTIFAVESSTDPDGTGKTLSITPGSYSVSNIHLQIRVSDWIGSGSNGSGVITAFEYTTGGGSVQVRLSVDDGATFASAVNVGTSFGPVAGFDVQRSGTVSYAAAAGKLRKATTLGGAYSDWYAVPASANPVCAIIPDYRRNMTTRNTAVSDPDVIIACSNGKWYWIDGTAATATDITPVASLIPSNADCLTSRYGNELAVWGTVSGVQKLYTSIDGGATWTLRGTITGGGKIRARRNDPSLSPNGQLYLAANSAIDFSSYWASGAGSDGPGPDADCWPRTMPVTDIFGLDTII